MATIMRVPQAQGTPNMNQLPDHIDGPDRSTPFAGQSRRPDGSEAAPSPTLLEELAGVLAARGAEGRLVRSASPASSFPAVGRHRLVSTLLGAVTDASLNVPSFLAYAETFRHALWLPESESVRVLFAALHSRLEYVRRKGAQPKRATVESALACLEMALTRHRRMTEQMLAGEVGVHPTHLGRLIKADTGLEFREWRLGMVGRMAVQELKGAGVQVAPIAYGLGFEHPTQFSRDFRRLLGLSPKSFVQLRASLQPSILRISSSPGDVRVVGPEWGNLTVD